MQIASLEGRGGCYTTIWQMCWRESLEAGEKQETVEMGTAALKDYFFPHKVKLPLFNSARSVDMFEIFA